MGYASLGMVVVAGVLAGFVQGVSGFGAGIIAMTVLPLTYGVVTGSAISVSMGLPFLVSMAWRYRAHVRPLQAVAPALLFMAVSSVCILVARAVDATLLKGALGAFLVVLSLYFLFVRRAEGSAAMGLVPSLACILISGACDGLFGIGGPLMVVYYLARTSDKRAYLGTLQLFFLVTTIWGVSFRAFQGIIVPAIVPVIVVAAAAQLAGQQVANRVVDRLDTAMIRRVTYVLIGLAGLYYLAQTLLSAAL